MSPQPLRAVIADDEPAVRRHLRDLLAHGGAQTVAECGTGADTVRAAAALRPELVCLDVRMPDGDGLDVARHLVGRSSDPSFAPQARASGPMPQIVFATGYPDYAAEAFDLDAADYLVKPLSASRVLEALQRVRRRLDSARRLSGPAPSPAPPARPPGRGPTLAPPARSPAAVVAAAHAPRVLVPAGDHHVALAPETIRYAEATGRGVRLHTDRGAFDLAIPLARLERVLAGCGFLRTHRAYLVNLTRVRAFVPWSRHVHSLLLDGGQETHIPVAKSRLAAFRGSVIWITNPGGRASGPGACRKSGGGQRGEPRAGPGDR